MAKGFERREEYAEWWRELRDLSMSGTTREFFAKYLAYLEWGGVYSGRRAILVEMVARMLKETEGVERQSEQDGQPSGG